MDRIQVKVFEHGGVSLLAYLQTGKRSFFPTLSPTFWEDTIFVYLVQEWQVFLDEITQEEFEKEKYVEKFGHVKKKLGVNDFPPELEQRIRLYVEIRNNLQHSRRKLRQHNLDRLKVKEFEPLHKTDGTKKKYKEGDAVAITAATVFDTNNDFVEAAKKLVH